MLIFAAMRLCKIDLDLSARLEELGHGGVNIHAAALDPDDVVDRSSIVLGPVDEIDHLAIHVPVPAENANREGIR